VLLCSDGLTDLVNSGEVRAGVERYAPDFDAAARALIEAANEAGGKDNITVVIVAGPAYREAAIRGRDTTATSRKTARTTVSLSFSWVWLLVGLSLGAAGGFFGPAVWNEPWNRFADAAPRTFVVGPAGISAMLSQAHSGDTVVIPQGRYRERIELRQGVILRAQVAGTVTLTSPDGGPALIARKIDAGGVEGVWIQGDLEAPLSTGIEITDSSPFVSNVKVTGAGTGIEVRGASAPAITSSQITNNLGAGILVSPSASPRIESNLIAANGNGTRLPNKQGDARPGVEVMEKAHPLLKDNGIVDNGAEPIWIHGRSYQPADFEENFFGGLPAKKAIRLIADSEDGGPGR
jgi:parallel beta-helix repeat protein